MQKFFIPIIMFFLTMQIASGQTLQITSSVNNQRPEVGDAILLSINLKANNPPQDFDLKSYLPEIKSIPGIKILSVQTGNKSSNFTVINGRKSSSISINRQYTIAAEKTGVIKIPAFSTVYNSRKYSTRPFNILASKSTKKNLNNLLPGVKLIHPYSRNTKVNNLLKEGHIFLRPVLDRKEYYTGEIIKVQYDLYVSNYFWDLWQTKKQMSLGLPQEEVYKGFHVLYQTEHKNYQPKFSKTKLGGKDYYYTKINEVVLQPLKLGAQTIPGWYLNGQFRRFFETFTIPSTPLHIATMPLPASNNLTGFSGGIGTFTFTTDLDKEQIKQSEIVALRLKISGEGNLQRIEKFELPSLPQFEIYGKVKRVAAENSEKKFKGDLIFEAVLRPKESGTLKVPPILFSYYDSKKKSYVTLESNPISLEVLPVQNSLTFNPEVSIGQLDNLNKTLVLNEDIRYIMTDEFTGNRRIAPHVKRVGFWAIQLMPLLLVVGSIYLRRQRNQLRGDSGLARRRSSKGLVNKRLKRAKKLLQENKPDELYVELSLCLRGFLSDQFNVAAHGKTADEMIALLHKQNLNDDLVNQTNEYLTACDTANYAPGSDSQERMQQMVDNIGELISTLAKEIK